MLLILTTLSEQLPDIKNFNEKHFENNSNEIILFLSIDLYEQSFWPINNSSSSCKNYVNNN